MLTFFRKQGEFFVKRNLSEIQAPDFDGSKMVSGAQARTSAGTELELISHLRSGRDRADAGTNFHFHSVFLFPTRRVECPETPDRHSSVERALATLEVAS